MLHRDRGALLFDRKREHLVSEDRGHTWAFAIEMLMGERNKIESKKLETLQKVKSKYPQKWGLFA